MTREAIVKQMIESVRLDNMMQGIPKTVTTDLVYYSDIDEFGLRIGSRVYKYQDEQTAIGMLITVSKELKIKLTKD